MSMVPAYAKNFYRKNKFFVKYTENRLINFYFGGKMKIRWERVPYHSIGVSPSGKATDSDSVIRWFESSYPSQIVIIRTSSYFARRSDYFVLLISLMIFIDKS